MDVLREAVQNAPQKSLSMQMTELVTSPGGSQHGVARAAQHTAERRPPRSEATPRSGRVRAWGPEPASHIMTFNDNTNILNVRNQWMFYSGTHLL